MSDVFDDRLPPAGHNNPPLARDIAATEGDFAAVTTAFLGDEYASQPKVVQSLLSEASALLRDPTTGELKPINDDDTKGKVISLIKRIRDSAKALEAFHAKEKQPYLRGGQAVDQFFFGMIDKLARRAKTNKPGAADTLNQMLTDYDNAVLAAERAKRLREAEEAARVAREVEQRRQEELRIAEEARRAAERARKPEVIAEKLDIARDAEAKVDDTTATVAVLAAKAEEARIETLRHSADIMRHRGEDGTLSTVREEPYAEILDRVLLNQSVLWPHIPLAALEQALREWAKSTDYRQPMAGAAIGRRNKSIVR